MHVWAPVFGMALKAAQAMGPKVIEKKLMPTSRKRDTNPDSEWPSGLPRPPPPPPVPKALNIPKPPDPPVQRWRW